jgi:3-deoxy-D-manno-octulosonate 8-phosphate phosphatase (KDO 8-P phosphatase)
MIHLTSLAKKIRCVICDLDGVLTDGRIYLDNNNDQIKSFYIQDGLGLKLLMCAGIEVAVITGSNHPMIAHRMRQLDIKHYFVGQTNKQQAYQDIKNTLNLHDDEFAYIGDDLPDRPIMQQTGLGVAVANAVKEVKDVANFVTTKKGGRGAVREVCDFILYAQEKFDLALDKYLNS